MKKVVFCLVTLMSFAFVSGRAGAAETKGPSGPAKGDPKSGMMKGAEPKAAMKASEPGCGQFIASMAGIPEKLSESATAVAELMDAHAALLGKEKAAQNEAKGLRMMAKTDKQVAMELKKASKEMKKAGSWPATPHEMAKMNADPKVQAATKKVIEKQKEVIALLQKSVADLEAQMKAAGK